MSQINRELHMTIQASLREAVARRHAYLTVEHLLYALAHDDAGANVLRHVGADLEVMRKDTERMRPNRPFVMTNLKTRAGLADVVRFIERQGLLVEA